MSDHDPLYRQAILWIDCHSDMIERVLFTASVFLWGMLIGVVL